jgi:hypothetical protein
MATKKTQTTAPLAPVVVKNETQAMDVATTSGRKRPFVAINDEGKLVVCSRRTAAKYGWEAQGALFTRSGGKEADKLAPWDAAAEKQRSKEAVPEANGKNHKNGTKDNGHLERVVRNVVRKELSKAK